MAHIPNLPQFPENRWQYEYKAADPALLLRCDLDRLHLPQPPWAFTYDEIDELGRLSVLRKQQDVDIRRQVDNSPVDEFLSAFPQLLQAKTAIRPLIDSVLQEIDLPIFEFKDKFNRGRPYHVDSTFKPLTFNVPDDPLYPNHPAYPSGHSTTAHSIAAVFSEVTPASSWEFEDWAFSIARNREIAGLHYRSDSLAGKDLAYQLIALLNEKAEFVKLKDAVRIAL